MYSKIWLDQNGFGRPSAEIGQKMANGTTVISSTDSIHTSYSKTLSKKGSDNHIATTILYVNNAATKPIRTTIANSYIFFLHYAYI